MLVVERILTLEESQALETAMEEDEPKRRRRQDPRPGVAPPKSRATPLNGTRLAQSQRKAKGSDDQAKSDWERILKIFEERMPAMIRGEVRLLTALEEALLTLRKAARPGSVKARRELLRLKAELEGKAEGQATGVLVVEQILPLEEWERESEGVMDPLDPLEGLPGITPEDIQALFDARENYDEFDDDVPEHCALMGKGG